MADAEARLADVAALLQRHRAVCRRDAAVLPPLLAEALLLATGGLRRPNIAGESTVDDPLLVDYEGGAKMLGTSARTVRRLVAEGELPSVECGGPRLRVADVRAYVAALPVRRVS